MAARKKTAVRKAPARRAPARRPPAPSHTDDRNEVDARIDELSRVLKILRHECGSGREPEIAAITKRQYELSRMRDKAQEPIAASIIRSHKAICEVKKMDEKAAYGNDPAVYYSLGICGEAGEMANAVVKSLRNGYDRKTILEAVKSELPDVIIYSYVLAYVLDIDLTELVNEKVDIVIQRATDGYYGRKIAARRVRGRRPA